MQVNRAALDRVLMPALNIVSVDEATGVRAKDDPGAVTTLTQLRASKDQLLLQVELVKRELGRLEAHSYALPPRRPMVLAVEPPQEDFRTMRVIRKLD